MKDPLGFITGEHDIVSSTGTFPSDINEKIGYALCMGWIYYKSCAAVKEIFENILNKNNKNNFDDQVQFNREFFNNQKHANFKLKVLDQSIVSRGQPHDTNTYVAHPLSGKHINREKFLKNKKLWILS